MRVIEIRSDAEFHGLKAQWNALLRDSASDTVFLTWEWLTSWWSSYGTPGDLRILAAFDEQHVLRGIAPLQWKTERRYGRDVPVRSFVGDGSNDSDYLDFFASRGYEERVMGSFICHLWSDLELGTILSLNEIPQLSPNLAALTGLADERHAIRTEAAQPCAVVRLPDEWEAYLKVLRPRFRTKVRSTLRVLEGRPEVRLGLVESPEQIEPLLTALFDLHTRRWAQSGKPGVFGWQQKREFYSAISRRFLASGWLHFTWLEWNHRILACQYGFVYGGKYFHLQEGYEPDCEHMNLGIGLRAWSIRKLITEGIKEYDFLGGVGRHKADWGAEVTESKRILIGNASLKSRMFCRGPRWEIALRESIAAALPDRVLVYRRARLERARQHGTQAVSESWSRKAVARCYYYTGLAAIARPFRERYRLSLNSGTGGSRVSWSQRTGPSGRILIYHAVNDDRDPFLPATPISVFERHMRYVASHYRVVSLAALLDHLESDSIEPLVAVTFDDGYQDNYRNALPVLQRYNIPATIFLATGSLDSAEPLWFERLADAIRETDREFIDLEVDLPRRFWMRTQEERLISNSGIFGVLRALEDSERNRHLSTILKQLAPPRKDNRQRRMLSWDEIRTMTSQRIDFGGHTVNHPFLSRLTADQAAWEVSECKRRIEQETQQPVHHFAYPNGRAEDFSGWNKDLIRGAGYKAAVSTIWGLNEPSTDRMELRRGGPWETDTAMFAYKFDWYQLING